MKRGTLPLPATLILGALLLSGCFVGEVTTPPTGKACDTAHPCPAGSVCVDAVCTACFGHTPDLCSGACTRLDSDRENCGECGHACAAGEVCSEGKCGMSCGGSTPTLCGDGCYDTRRDPAHCGACHRACEAGSSCQGGTCVADAPPPPDAGTPKPAGKDAGTVVTPPPPDAGPVVVPPGADAGPVVEPADSGTPPPAADASTPVEPMTTTVLRLGEPNLTVEAGQTVTLAMRFDAVPMGAEDLQVFVHFVDESGVQHSEMAADHAPPTPTSAWSGAVAYERSRVVPAATPAGKYSIRVGLYHYHPPYERIELEAGAGVVEDAERRYEVGTLTVTAPQVVTPPPGGAGPVGQNAADYVATFTDEFDSFDTSVWNDTIWYESSNPTKNYTVENGLLKIWPQRDGNGNFFNRTIDTDGRYYQTYGYFEMEARLPKGKGTWPAFWLFNHIGARRPEIDIMEAYAGGEGWGGFDSNGVPIPVAYGATIWIDAGVQGGMKMIFTPDLSADFHTYGLKWEPSRLTFYFDGQEQYAANVSMSDPMYIMLDLWFGSASGTPDDSTPQGKSNSYEVNYVKAWQFK